MQLAMIRNIIITCFVGLYFLQFIWSNDTLHYIQGIFAIFSILLSFRQARRIFQVIGSLFALVGLILMGWNEIPYTRLPLYMNSTALMIALLYVLPFLNNAIKSGRYHRSINQLLQTKSLHLGQLYYRNVIVSYVLSLFLFITAIPIVHDVIRAQISFLPTLIQQKFISRTVLRAFAAAMIWSPVEIMIALVCELTGAEYLSLLPWLLTISIALLITERGASLRFRSFPLPQTNEKELARATLRPLLLNIGKMLFALFLFIFIAGMLHTWLNISFFTAVTFTIIPFSFGWAFVIRRFSFFVTYSRLSWPKQIEPLQNFIVLFLTLGLFNQMMELSILTELLQTKISLLADTPLLLFLTIQMTCLLFPFIGFHPFVTLGILGVLIQPFLGTINPESIAIVLLAANLATGASGTYNTTVTLMTGLLRCNPYRISIWNIGYAWLYSTLGVIVAMWLV